MHPDGLTKNLKKKAEDHLIWYYTSWVGKSNSGVLRFRNKQASKPSSSLCSTLHKDRQRKETFIL